MNITELNVPDFQFLKSAEHVYDTIKKAAEHLHNTCMCTLLKRYPLTKQDSNLESSTLNIELQHQQFSLKGIITSYFTYGIDGFHG